jgi:hypothetical protein
MAKHHGARQQKKIAKLKAKRAQKRSSLFRRTSKDPTIRLREVAKWPVVQALVASDLWKDGIGSLAIARQESEDGLVFAVFLVDVYCLGVKDAFWRAGTPGEFNELLERMEKNQAMRPITPGCLVKIVQGAVAYAQSFGFAPHPDYRHAAKLLEGIDPAACQQKFTFGRDGKPLYIQGPNESRAQAEAIMQRIAAAGGHYVVGGPLSELEDFAGIEDPLDELDELDEDDSPDEEPGIYGGSFRPNPWNR